MVGNYRGIDCLRDVSGTVFVYSVIDMPQIGIQHGLSLLQTELIRGVSGHHVKHVVHSIFSFAHYLWVIVISADKLLFTVSLSSFVTVFDARLSFQHSLKLIVVGRAVYSH